MEMTGEQLIPVAQGLVWAALNDPAVLKTCIPGCEVIEPSGENEYKVAMTASVGPVKARFNGKLQLLNIKAPDSYSLSFEGSGGAAGFGKGSADVSLAPAEGGTRLSYTAKAQVGGKLAQVGSRLIDGVAKKMADDFFTRFKASMAVAAPAPAPAPAAAQAGGAEATAGVHAAPAAGPAATAPRSEKAETPAAFNPLWIVGVVLAAMFIIAWSMGH